MSVSNKQSNANNARNLVREIAGFSYIHIELQ